MAQTMEELLAEIERKAKENLGKAPASKDAGVTVYEGSNTAPEGSATVYEGEATVPESCVTVYENNETVPEDSDTVYETEDANLTSAAEPSYAKGEMLLDTYTVESDPIHGGMGSVWRVHHNNWNVYLAMKRPQAKLFQSERQKENFIGECEAWINLGLHPNIVSCYYVREIDSVPTIFSEWMENGSLENHIKKGTLYTGSEQEQQERLLDIAIQFARGLHYAHEQGLIHQDVKPDNLLLSNDWDAKVADFGLAKARAQLTVLEGENTVHDAGATVMAPSGGYTPAYCSMEQMDGKPLTRRTDIYSWAVSVMEMYLGERLWDNGVVAGFGCETYFSNCRVKMPEELKTLLKKCMAAEPEDRPHDFAEIEAELGKIYECVAGSDYPRPVATASANTADSLNNRALSYLDIGKPGNAEETWEKALALDNTNANANYNYALHQWRSGVITRYGAEDLLKNVKKEDVRKKLISDLVSEDGGVLKITMKNYGELFGIYVRGFDRDARRVCGVKQVPKVKPDVYSPKIEMKRTFQVFDCATGTILFKFQSADKYSLEEISISSDGNFVLITYHETVTSPKKKKEVKHITSVFSIETGEIIRSFDRTDEKGKHSDYYAWDCYGIMSPDNRFILFQNFKGYNHVYYEDCEYHSYSRYTLICSVFDEKKFGVCGRAIPEGVPYRVDDMQTSCLLNDELIITPDTRVLRKHENKMCISRIDAKYGIVRDTLYEPGFPSFNSTAFSKDGLRMLAKSGETVYLLDISGTKPKILKEFTSDYEEKVNHYRVCFLNDEKYAACLGETKGFFWNIETGQLFKGNTEFFNQAGYRGYDELFFELEAGIAETCFTRLSQAEYKLSAVESTDDRQSAQREYDNLLAMAQERYSAGETSAALAALDQARLIPGYSASLELLGLRNHYAQKLTKVGIRKIVPVEEIAPEKEERIKPSEKLSETVQLETNRLLDEMIADCSEIFSEYKTSSKFESASSNGSMFLYSVWLSKKEAPNCPLKYDVKTGSWLGAAIFDSFGKLIFEDKQIWTGSEYATMPTIRLCPGGKYILYSPTNNSLSLIDICTGERHKLTSDYFKDLFFTPDGKFVIGKNDKNKVSIINLDTLSVWAEYEFPEQYGDIYVVGDDSFAVLRNGKYRLCLIDWEYESQFQEQT